MGPMLLPLPLLGTTCPSLSNTPSSRLIATSGNSKPHVGKWRDLLATNRGAKSCP
ncbi:unnamed protein product, partial [Dovyalis caffra]